MKNRRKWVKATEVDYKWRLEIDGVVDYATYIEKGRMYHDLPSSTYKRVYWVRINGQEVGHVKTLKEAKELVSSELQIKIS